MRLCFDVSGRPWRRGEVSVWWLLSVVCSALARGTPSSSFFGLPWWRGEMGRCWRAAGLVFWYSSIYGSMGRVLPSGGWRGDAVVLPLWGSVSSICASSSSRHLRRLFRGWKRLGRRFGARLSSEEKFWGVVGAVCCGCLWRRRPVLQVGAPWPWCVQSFKFRRRASDDSCFQRRKVLSFPGRVVVGFFLLRWLAGGGGGSVRGCSSSLFPVALARAVSVYACVHLPL